MSRDDDIPRAPRKPPAGHDADALRAELRRLRQKPGWDPAKHVTEAPLEQLMRLEQEARDALVYDAATTCAACTTARTTTADPTALCDAHLAEAMGF